MMTAISFLLSLLLQDGASDVLRLDARSKDDAAAAAEKTVQWKASKTAVVICDMWDAHGCKSATRRVTEMAPKLNEFVKHVRARGALIVHAPSETMAFYKDAPQRRRALDAPAAKPPEPVQGRRFDATREGEFPIDDSDGGCDDDPPCPSKPPYPWRRQIAAIEIADADVISDKGQEIYNVFEPRGINIVVLTGVHTNMCVLGRSFGIRQWVRLGKNVMLRRDLTDAMCNPRKSPRVSHDEGTQLVIRHIERHGCASFVSGDVLK